MTRQSDKTRKLTLCGILGGVATVLMFFNFNVPLMPSFIKMDFSELPALLAAYSYGPLAGVTVCFIKNILNLFSSSTGGVGELSNFMLGCMFVVPAGIVYSKIKTKKAAFLGALLGAVTMAVCSVITNYYIVYPVYTAFMPMEAIMGMYQAILPSVNNLWQALVIFNMPFTFIKGMVNVVMAMWIYKPLSPLLKGKK
ncbi:MAG: ECF transporter S component [Oscillospiraceae bacterium]|nr:ECF transporter S component [Oscillospiraceae bacterium]